MLHLHCAGWLWYCAFVHSFHFMYNTCTTNCAWLFKKWKIYAQVHNSTMLCIRQVLCIAQLCIMTKSIERCSYLCCSTCKLCNRALFWAIRTNTILYFLVSHSVILGALNFNMNKDLVPWIWQQEHIEMLLQLFSRNTTYGRIPGFFL